MGDRSPALAVGRGRTGSASAIAAAGLAALAVAIGIGRFAFTPLLPLMQADAGVSIAQGGWLASANYIGYLVGALTAVALRIRPVTAIRSGLVAIGLLTLAMAFTQRFLVWMALRAVAGVASAWVLVFVSAWCLDRLPPLRRPWLPGVVFSGVGTGIAAAGGLCLLVMRAGASSSLAWSALGALSLAVAIAIWPAFDGDDAASPPAPRAPEAGPSRHAESVRLVLCYGAYGFGYIIPATFLPVMAKQAIDDPGVFGWAWPVFGVAAGLATLCSAGRATVSARRLWTLCHLVMALGVALPVLWHGIVAIMLAALCVGGTFTVITMVGMQEARRVAGLRARGLMAAMTSAFALAQIAGPISVSAVAKAGGGFSGPLLLAGVLLVSSAWVLSWTRGEGSP